MTEAQRYYGCCSDIPEQMLHTGDKNDYPKWYINYLRGIGNKKLPAPVKRLLNFLSDGKWCKKFLLPSGKNVCGIMSLEACEELELIESRTYKTDGDGDALKAKITKRGRAVLKTGELP